MLKKKIPRVYPSNDKGVIHKIRCLIPYTFFSMHELPQNETHVCAISYTIDIVIQGDMENIFSMQSNIRQLIF